MSKRIFVNANTPDETRVAVLDGDSLVDFDTENTAKKPIKGNVYLARVSRVEPSLQAVFIEYGPEHHGFLPFSEIHPDYYRIPVDDLRQEQPEEEEGTTEEEPSSPLPVFDDFAYPEGAASHLDLPPAPEQPVKSEKQRHKKKRRYSVQEVIFPKQVLLVQATKDERGSKCAAFTTYLSLAGQYCVLMPNAGERSGGISKRIQEDETRTRLKNVIKDLAVPEKMSIIIRTAGQERTKTEIRRDYDYLTRLWNDIRAKTLESKAPLLIHEEADILARVVRDLYHKDVDEIQVDSREAYKKVREFMKRLSPSSVKKVKLFKEEGHVSLFNAFDIERQIVAMVTPRVPLPSGGSLVIGQTEALVAIDVNSGRATRERNLDTTALKTNLEAAREIAKQLRLRDLSGLIVIDFIDMYDHKHNSLVEKEFRQHVAADRARIQLGSISQFGLLELSRQRLRSSVMEIYSEVCPHCQGRGMTYSQHYFISVVLHALEKAVSEVETTQARLYTPANITNLLLNEHRKSVCELEIKHHCQITIQTDENLADVDFIIDNGRGAPALLSLVKAPEESQDEVPQKETQRKGRNAQPRGNQEASTKRPNDTPQQKEGQRKDRNSPKQSVQEESKERPPQKESSRKKQPTLAPEESKPARTAEEAAPTMDAVSEGEGVSPQTTPPAEPSRRRRRRHRHRRSEQSPNVASAPSEASAEAGKPKEDRKEKTEKAAEQVEATPSPAPNVPSAPKEEKTSSSRRNRKRGRSRSTLRGQETLPRTPSGSAPDVSTPIETALADKGATPKKRGRPKKEPSVASKGPQEKAEKAPRSSTEGRKGADSNTQAQSSPSSEGGQEKKSWIKRIFQTKDDES